MNYEIETCQERDGNWVASVHAVPGLKAYGYSREEALATAGRLAAICMGRGDEFSSTQIMADPLERSFELLAA